MGWNQRHITYARQPAGYAGITAADLTLVGIESVAIVSRLPFKMHPI